MPFLFLKTNSNNKKDKQTNFFAVFPISLNVFHRFSTSPAPLTNSTTNTFFACNSTIFFNPKLTRSFRIFFSTNSKRPAIIRFKLIPKQVGTLLSTDDQQPGPCKVCGEEFNDTHRFVPTFNGTSKKMIICTTAGDENNVQIWCETCDREGLTGKCPACDNTMNEYMFFVSRCTADDKNKQT